MSLTVYFVDAFTDKLFKGNQAAVIITEQWLSDEVMQSVASENNLSETAFLVPYANGAYNIRWFSPITEIAFCGHATLASAFVLFEQDPALYNVTFKAKAVGELPIGKTKSGYIEMDFPNTKPKCVDVVPEALLEGLSLPPDEVYVNNQAYFAIYHTEQDVLTVKRNNEKLKTLAPLDVVTTAKSASKEYDFISRYFWPANGGDEDPVTGSIHTGLAPFWAERLNKAELVAYQASKRGGVLRCSVKNNRVVISGKAVKYLQGTIHL